MTARMLLLLLLIGTADGCARGGEPTRSSEGPAIRVRTVAARLGEIEASLDVTGETAALDVVRLASPVAGRITWLAARPGDELPATSVVARLLPLESEAALRGFGLLEAGGRLPSVDAATMSRLRKQVGAREVSLRAPFHALVSQRLRNPEEQVAPGDVVVELFDPRSLYVLAQVPLDAARQVRVGMRVEISGATFEGGGRVAAVLSALTPVAVSLPLRVALDAPPARALVGEPVRCRITTRRHRRAVLIPRSALLFFDRPRRGEAMVDVGGVARRRALRLGLRSRSDVEVLAGLRAGELVIVEGQYALPDRAAIEAVEEPATGER
jgi:multidrug efflux pump subunit AcrA (membrane-fusion protein)